MYEGSRYSTSHHRQHFVSCLFDDSPSSGSLLVIYSCITDFPKIYLLKIKQLLSYSFCGIWVWLARPSGLGFHKRLHSRYCRGHCIHLEAWLGNDLLPSSLKWLLVEFISSWSVELKASVPHWLLAESLLQFFASWASLEGSSPMVACFPQSEQVREQESFCHLISEKTSHYLVPAV